MSRDQRRLYQARRRIFERHLRERRWCGHERRRTGQPKLILPTWSQARSIENELNQIPGLDTRQSIYLCRESGGYHFHLRHGGRTKEGDKAMAEAKQEATTYNCDAPGCDVQHVTVGEQEPKGRRLTSQLPYLAPVKAYACKATHVRPATEAAEEAAAKLADMEAEADEQIPGEGDGDDATVKAVNEAFTDDLDEAMGAPAAQL